MFRTHTCGELRKKDEGKKVTLSGWVNKIRTHGSLTFIDIRDRYGITQLTIDKEVNVKKEYVIKIEGIVKVKPEPNENIKTGEIEVEVKDIKVINESQSLPLDENATEDTRLKYRYLDLRRPEMVHNFKFKSDVVFSIREFFNKHDFLEVETPALVKSTPEGARDFLVPSRVNKGKFYALPQSPQLYKQILMVAGVDKYYQLAKCFRDEELRADRQPEHTQVDFEMSFVTSDEIRAYVEKLMKHVFEKVNNTEIAIPFPTFSYEEAMERFGSDKPDIRFDLELNNITEIAKTCDFNVFQNAEEIYTLFIPKEYSRKEIDKYTELVKIYQAKGLAYTKLVEGKFEGGIEKFLNEETKKKILSLTKDTNGTFFFGADKKRIVQKYLGHLRNALAKDASLTNVAEFKFCWVNDFPLFAYNEEEKTWEPEHHAFSMPKEEFIDNFEEKPHEALGDLWDLVLNGWEMASGSIRVSNPKIQERILEFIGIGEEEAKEKFGFLLEAYEYGGPVHGGMGIGVERLVTLMLGKTDIREVIAFPKNKSAQCPMDDSPNNVSKEQLDELHIQTLK